MENDAADLDDVDEAAKAFGKLRREVTTMRLAIEQLVDEPNRIEIPDYTETLADMSARIAGMSKRLKSIGSSPAMELTPSELAGQIATAGVEARKVEQTALTDATNNLGVYVREMASFTASARTAQQQNKWLFGFGAFTFVVGIIATTVFFGW
ncbi:MAG: hypothetical protein COA41_20490 [Sphingopyxis sp.]|nr:MAG: hypothetical protein COA41_20490 [Sphingopyxis sp.]